MDYLKSMIASRPAERAGTVPKKRPNPLTYPQSSDPFNDELFIRPTSEYRGCPFWAWNNKLDQAQLLRQIDNFAAMGMGGFHMHVRTGLDTEYMGTEFMEIVHSCVKYAESKNMLACLYDDDRWPSGAAGGRVIKKNSEYKGQHILFTPHVYGSVRLGDVPTPASARATRSENGYLLAIYDICLDENGCLKSSRRLKEGDKGTNLWYAYVETNPESSWFNNQTYVDTLSMEAMAEFIEITHKLYKEKVGADFGTVIPCIFTDEPQFATKTQLWSPKATNDIFLPWTSDLPNTFKNTYSTELVDELPQLVWNFPCGLPSLTRYRFHDHVCERFVSAFIDQIAQWCKSNNIILNGHMMEEPTLRSQTTALGEAMRCYRSMQMPGMDLLLDRVEYNTAKQASSVSRQNGTRGTMSEIYGVTHWNFTFEGHKGCGDWQAALGITFRVHHLTWVSMAGEGKRDYPACIGYQSPWYQEYSYVEDYFARVGVAMTRGKALTRIGVVHPIESFWLCFGPNRSGDEMASRDKAFADLTSWLLFGLLDFDFISESLLPQQIGRITNKLQVGSCEYDVIILPNLRTIRYTTLKILRKFVRAGGKLICAGSAPELVDAKVPTCHPILDQSENVHWSQQVILAALESYKEVRVLRDDEGSTNTLLHQIREDGEDRYVFFCNRDRNLPLVGTVQLKGNWKVQFLDTLTGNQSRIEVHHRDGWTNFPHVFDGCGSLLLRLSPAIRMICLPAPVPHSSIPKYVSTRNIVLERIELSEPNVLMLDYAEFRINNGKWSERTEVLRIDNIIRRELHLPRRGGAWKQPYAVPGSERRAIANVTLRFKFQSYIDLDFKSALALEAAETVKVSVNGHHVNSTDSLEWWVDEAIKTAPIPANTIRAGENLITLEFPFGILTNIERAYLLGDFAVHFLGNKPVLQALDPRSLTWGDITTQGLPFYVGNITYHSKFSLPIDGTTSSSVTTLSVPQFSSPVLTVHDPNHGRLGRIAFQPRSLRLGNLEAGHHQISITAFGNRYNAFGHIHVPDGKPDGCWPDLWRSGGDWWTDRYNVKPVGVLQCATVTTELVETSEAQQGNSEDWVVLEA